MKFLTGLTALATGLMVVLAAKAADNQVRVTGDQVNLRSVPGTDGEVISQVSRGDLLTAAGEEGEWTKVAPPEDVDLWVYGELVQDSAVAVPKLLVRGGPGINYKSVGQLSQGEKLRIRGEHAGWLSIAPPRGCYLWISSSFVENAGAPGAGGQAPQIPAVHPVTPSVGIARQREQARRDGKKQEVPAASQRGASVRQESAASSGQTVKRFAPPAIDPRTLVGSREQGRTVEMHGLLRPAGRAVWRRPSSYRLVQDDKQGRPLTVCYLVGNDSQLEDLLGKEVVVSGREYWVQGVLHPAVAVEKIVIGR